MIEPIYLRYVHDSLSKGSLNAENAAALPQGFIGIYEQEFTQKTPANERKKVLNQLALWALFKGPVSANMAAAVLELEEQQMKDLVDTYSSWFNSPESSKYQLYHERLRVYLLQKLKAEEIQVLNEKLISFLESAVKQAKGEEDEYYALKHLHQHMALESQLGNHYDRLHGYVNQESLWRRQIQLSKGYAWSQNAVQQGIKEGARRKHEMNTIRSTVNSVKLMTQEQNSADDILNLLNEGDYPTALKRADNWEGERQFKLYLLFIHELTIGTSKDAEFRKEACKAVLEAIEQTPEDHSVLDWCNFYPELAIYKYHEELVKMELDGMVIWKRGQYTLEDLMARKDVNIEIIKSLADEITDEAYVGLSKILIEQGEKEVSLSVVSKIQSYYYKIDAYVGIAKILIEQGEKEESKKAMLEALRMASNIESDKVKSEAYARLSKILLEQGEKEESKKAIQEALRVASEMSIMYDKSEAYCFISKILVEHDENELAHKVIQELINAVSGFIECRDKSWIYANIYKALMFQQDEEGARKAIEDSLRIASNIEDDWDKSEAYEVISKSLMESGDKDQSLQVAYELTIANQNSEAETDIYVTLCPILIGLNHKEEALKIASKINDHYYKSEVYRDISKALLKQGNKKESIRLASEIEIASYKFDAYVFIIKVLLEHPEKELADKIMHKSLLEVYDIKDNSNSLKAYKDISEVLLEKDRKQEFYKVIKESLLLKSVIVGSWDQPYAPFQEYKSSYIGISKFLIEQGNKEAAQKAIHESIQVASKINDDYNKSEAYKDLSELLIEQGNKKESIRLASEIKFASEKMQAFQFIIKVLMEQGDKEQSFLMANEKIDFGSKNKFEIQNLINKSESFLKISEVLINQGDKSGAKKAILESISSANALSNVRTVTDFFYNNLNDIAKINVYVKISKVLIGLGEKEEAKKTTLEALRLAQEIVNERSKSKAYAQLSKILLEQGDKQKALSLTSEIINENIKSGTYAEISKILMELGEKEESKIAMQEALRLASDITHQKRKSEAYLKISKILMELDNKEESKKAIQKSHRVALDITDASEKSESYLEISKVLMEQGKIKEAIQVAVNIKEGSERLKVFLDFGKKLTFNESQNILPIIPTEENRSGVIKGMSENIYEKMELSEAIYPYLYHHSKYTENLSNILFHQAKIACFFEEERNEEKLDMLSEVLDIKDWRRISA